MRTIDDTIITMLVQSKNKNGPSQQERRRKNQQRKRPWRSVTTAVVSCAAAAVASATLHQNFYVADAAFTSGVVSSSVTKTCGIINKNNNNGPLHTRLLSLKEKKSYNGASSSSQTTRTPSPLPPSSSSFDCSGFNNNGAISGTTAASSSSTTTSTNELNSNGQRRRHRHRNRPRLGFRLGGGGSSGGGDDYDDGDGNNINNNFASLRMTISSPTSSSSSPLSYLSGLECTMKTPSSPQQQQQMFIGVKGIDGGRVGTTNIVSNSNRYGGRANTSAGRIVTTTTTTSELNSNVDGRRPKLGFRVGGDDDDDDDDNNNDLVTSHLDVTSWANKVNNNGISPIKNRLLSSSTFWQQQQQEQGSSQNSHIVPGWFPWIPTQSQIQLLKVVELKEACKQRSLKRTGNKATLQNRLWEWTRHQHEKRVANRRIMSSSLNNNNFIIEEQPGLTSSEEEALMRNRIRKKNEKKLKDSGIDIHEESSTSTKVPNSFQEWTDDSVERLLNKGKAIRKEQREGKKPKQVPDNTDKAAATTKQKEKDPEEYLKELTKTFYDKTKPLYSNEDVKKMYTAARRADQDGNFKLSKQILLKLKEATPNDARIFRRLARMEMEHPSDDGRSSARSGLDGARLILLEGIQLHPNNGYLWHGLGQLEVKANKVDAARRHFKKAIDADPTIPNPYHAWGTLEHLHGHIAVAMNILKRGISYCPTNHRLHHALGDLYRDANMLDMAERSYKHSLEHRTEANNGFAYTALAFVAYEKGLVKECRSWLNKAVSLNDGRNNRAWVALAQFEESEGNTDAARKVYVKAINTYEQVLLQRYNNKKQKKKKKTSMNNMMSSINITDPITLKNTLLKSVPTFRSGDKFINVYKNWARFEQKYSNGNVANDDCNDETVDDVYTRATIVFPNDHELLLHWAQYHGDRGNVDRARELYEEACQMISNRNADPYRLYGEYEMSMGNYDEARSILYGGAQAMSTSVDGGLTRDRGMAQLYHTWAMCEWHLNNLSRAEVLFDHALRLTDGGQQAGSKKDRSYIFYSIARLEYYRGEYELAQHCVALCLKENALPILPGDVGGNSKVWSLWADIAYAMGNDRVAVECQKQAKTLKEDEDDGGIESLTRYLRSKRRHMKTKTSFGNIDSSSQPSSSLSSGPAATGDMQHLMKRDPWADKIFGHPPGGFDGVEPPSKKKTVVLKSGTR